MRRMRRLKAINAPLAGLLLGFLAAPLLPAETLPDETAPPAAISDASPPPETEAKPSLSPKIPLTRADLEVIKAAATAKTYQPFADRELGFETPRISALKMVRIALDFNPQVQLQRETVEQNAGAVQIETGVFDTHVTGRVGAHLKANDRRVNYRTHPVISPAPTPYPNPLRNRNGVFDYEVGVQKMLRNGIVINPHIGFTQSFDRDYGETFSDDTRGTVGFSVFIPLGKGGGTLSNQARELSARYDLLASVLQLRFITSQNVANTLQAYWACKAAEEVYKLRQEAEEIAMRLLNVATSLVEGDELAPAQLLQIVADHDTTMANRIRAGIDLIAARQALATAVGFSSSSLLLAPLTSDDFPIPEAADHYPSEQSLIEVALRFRDDVRAAQETVKSRKVLLDASYMNLRPSVNLKLTGGYIPFETRNQTVITKGDNWQGSAELQIDWPLENNAALGAYTQSQALLQSSRIAVEDTQRTTISSVITSLAELKGTAVNVKLFEGAALWYRKALVAQEELFTLGHGSMTDTITARQRLVDAQVNYVMAKRNYANSLVRLRFATGVLFFSDEQGSWIDPNAWNIVPFASMPPPPPEAGRVRQTGKKGK